MTNEEWRPVIGFEGFYSVSSAGRVRRDTSQRIIRPWIDKRGYATCSLSKRGVCTTGVKIHQLVAAAFIGPCPVGKEVNHVDGFKANNCDTNLEYLTRRENVQHAHRTGIAFVPKGEQQGLSKLTDAAVAIIRQTDAKIPGVTASLATRFGVSRVAIRCVRRRHTWKHLP